jgi:hypothetical protein
LLSKASTAIDAAQLVIGMATGFDYTGTRMYSGDFALRGLGVVLGLVPSGSAIARISGVALDRAFATGAAFVRKLSLEQHLLAAATKSRELAIEIPQTIGRWVREAATNAEEFAQTAREARALLGTASDAQQYAKLKQLVGYLRELSLPLDRRREVLESGLVASARIVKSEDHPHRVFYRWWGGNAKERGYYLTDQLFESAGEARIKLAIEGKNSMEFMAKYRLKPGYRVLVMEIAPNNSHRGGAWQYLPESLEALEKLE